MTGWSMRCGRGSPPRAGGPAQRAHPGRVRKRALEFERAGARVSARPQVDPGEGFTVAPTLLEVGLSGLTTEIADECFGPLLIVVRYDDTADLDAALATVPRR
ncbi:hypothetical protein NKG94_04685 [Micromonospora sp. M12]